MLEEHLNAIEKVLLAQGIVASNAGHPNLIGGPKEWFIRDFLNDHLPSTVKVGQGEIINPHSESSANLLSKNQIDIVLYRHNFPKIAYSRNDSAFLRESIISTIEVKSKIGKGEFKKACKASHNLKNREYIQHPNPKRPYDPIGLIIDLTLPPVYSYVVAFDTSTRLSTMAKWLPALTADLKTSPDMLIDMMIVLGKGTIWRLASFPQLGRALQNKYPRAIWAYLEQDDKNLLLLFLHMLSHMTSTSQIPIDILGYAKNVMFKNITVFP